MHNKRGKAIKTRNSIVNLGGGRMLAGFVLQSNRQSLNSFKNLLWHCQFQVKDKPNEFGKSGEKKTDCGPERASDQIQPRYEAWCFSKESEFRISLISDFGQKVRRPLGGVAIRT